MDSLAGKQKARVGLYFASFPRWVESFISATLPSLYFAVQAALRLHSLSDKLMSDQVNRWLLPRRRVSQINDTVFRD